MTELTTDNPEIQQQVTRFRTVLDDIRGQVREVIVGQDEVVEALLVTLLVSGHCLITGLPGTAKTLLVRTLAAALGLEFKRIQFTPDLMPTDVTGTDIVEENDAGARSWRFVPGPIFTNVLLADEINRTPPKTQAALLEAMQEARVTVRGITHQLASPFFVLATQNPIELEGTYPLPEAQLDRFLFNVVLDYLPAAGELEVVKRFTNRIDLPEVRACTNAEEVTGFQWLVRQVPVADSVAQVAVNLVRATRPADPLAPESVRKYVNFGASVRASLFLVLAAKARALLAGRYHVQVEDILELAKPVLRHRVLTNYYAEADGLTVDQVLDSVIAAPALRQAG
ncbi:MAG: AAA family ATPase [Pseudomonadota bacterium]